MTDNKNPGGPALVWLRRDLRIEDNPALHAARESGRPVIPLYIHDEKEEFAPGAAAKWWLHYSLKALSEDLKDAGAPLILRRGDSAEILTSVVKETKAGAVFWNRRYGGGQVAADKKLKAELTDGGVEVQSFNGALLREPWEVETKSGGPYRVFTPFWKALSDMGPAREETLPRMRKIDGPAEAPSSDDLGDWALTPENPDWASEFSERWTPGEQGARDKLNDFLRDGVDGYAEDRNRPDMKSTSRLSPHLAFGEISPLQIWRETHARIEEGSAPAKHARKFLSEVGWREFSYNLLFYNPELPSDPLREEFADFPWRDDQESKQRWRRGQTGYPIVDAGMRELWRTGWMHNRVRMIVASFLVKNLLVPWQDGEAWFWDTLVDADPANNSASWQWVAGCGADAAPYFRIFNPVTQSEKFDPDGDYIRKFAPELADLPDKHIHKPWDAPDDVLKKAGVKLGETYPERMVDLGRTRQRALDAYDEIKKG